MFIYIIYSPLSFFDKFVHDSIAKFWIIVGEFCRFQRLNDRIDRSYNNSNTYILGDSIHNRVKIKFAIFYVSRSVVLIVR